MPHAVCLMNTGFADTATDIIYANVYPCFFAHNIDFHTVFSNYLLFLNSFLNVIFIRMILILFTPLVMKWELLIIIKRINKGYVAPTVFISFISLVLICILYLSQQKLFESQQSGLKNSLSPRVPRELRDGKNCPIHRVAEMEQDLIRIFLFDEIHFSSTKYNFIR